MLKLSKFCAYTGQKLAQLGGKIAQARWPCWPLFASLPLTSQFKWYCFTNSHLIALLFYRSRFYHAALSEQGKNLLAQQIPPNLVLLWNSIRLSPKMIKLTHVRECPFLKFWSTVKESGHRGKSGPNLGYQLGKCGRPWQMWQTIGHSPQFSLKQRLLEILRSGTGGNLGKIAAKVVFTRHCREPHWFCPKWGPMK